MKTNAISHDIRLVLLSAALLMMAGCKAGSSLESAARLEAAGQYADAARAYESYLAGHSEGPLAARACLGAAKSHDQLGDFERAIEWYGKVGAQYAGSDEEIEALLGMGFLYKEKLKDAAQGLACYDKAIHLTLSRDNIREAIQALTDAQYLTATAYYSQREFKKAGQAVDTIIDTYPSVFMPTDTRMKVDSLADRVDRADALAMADSTMIVVREELPYNKSFDGDFPAAPPAARDALPSPDNQYIARLAAVTGKIPSLYVGKAPKPGQKVRFLLIPRTEGISFPAWSPNSQELVYRRIAGPMRRLEKVDMATKKTQVLFSTPSRTLGLQSAFHPSGNKIAFVYEGNVWLLNANGTNKCMLKTKQKLDYNAQLQWSADGTMVRYRLKDAKKNDVDGLLVLDILKLES